VDDTQALERLQDSISGDPNGVGIFSDPAIEAINACPGDPAVGTHVDVKNALRTSVFESANLDGTDVLVAIVDTGLNMTHLRNKGVMANFDPSRSWTPIPSGVPGSMPIGHGSMCAFDACLSAPNCTLLDYAILFPQSFPNLLSNAIQAFSRLLDVLTGGVEPPRGLVVNNSWGLFKPSISDFPVGHPSNYSDNPDHPFNVIVDSLADAGADICFAAGNCGEECPDGRCETTNSSIFGANSHPSVLSVGGVTINRARVGYSSKGPGRLQAEKPDLCAYTHFLGSEAFGAGSPDGGTSAACPVAAGVIAAIRTGKPFSALSPAALRQMLRRNADDLGAQGFDFAHGHGVINVPDTLEALDLLVEPEGEVKSLPIGKQVVGQLLAKDDTVLYHFRLGEKLNIVLDGPTGADFDLYIRKGVEPTVQDYDQRGITPEADEHVKVEVDEPGDYYVMVHSYEGSGDFKLKAELE
jgi:subtilisin family serine protease